MLEVITVLPLKKVAPFHALIVEPDLSQIMHWTEFIETFSNDFSVEIVTNLGDAVRAIMRKQMKGEVFDLIVSEIFLSGWGSGIDLWRKYKSEARQFILTSVISEEIFQSYFINASKRPPYLPKSQVSKERIETVRAKYSA